MKPQWNHELIIVDQFDPSFILTIKFCSSALTDTESIALFVSILSIMNIKSVQCDEFCECEVLCLCGHHIAPRALARGSLLPWNCSHNRSWHSLLKMFTCLVESLAPAVKVLVSYIAIKCSPEHNKQQSERSHLLGCLCKLSYESSAKWHHYCYALSSVIRPCQFIWKSISLNVVWLIASWIIHIYLSIHSTLSLRSKYLLYSCFLAMI